jgi:hypothetical protein
MERDAEVIEVLNELVVRKPRWGFWKLHDRLRLDGLCINHKRLHRVYCELGLQFTEANSPPGTNAATKAADRSERAEPDVGGRLHVGRALRPSLVPHVQRDRRSHS